MKTLHITILISGVILITVLIAPQYAYANTCAVKLTDYTTPQFFLLSDNVFAGTVQQIDNTTDHQWKVVFTVNKQWKGSVGQKPLIVMTNTLQGCGYSITSGEKYLVYTNGYPPNLNPISSKAYADAQSEITLLDDPKFQDDEKIKEELYKKLVNAKDGLSNLMGSKMSKIPISFVGINDLSLTLDVGIADKKAAFPSGTQEYKQKLEKIVGDIPMTVQYSDYVSVLPEIISSHPKPLSSPLEQFKSGIKIQYIQCKEGHVLIMKAKDYSPACVSETSVYTLMLHGWALGPPLKGDIVYLMKTNYTGKIFVQYTPIRNYTDVQIHSRIYDGKTGYQIPPENMAVTAVPDIISHNSNTIVTYAITTHSTKGIYWLEVDTCQFIPIVVGIDSSQITSSDLQYIMTGWKCPGPSLQFHPVGFDGITPKYVNLEQ